MYKQALDLINAGFVILDKELKIIHWNRWLSLYSGIKPELIVDHSVFDFFPNLKTPQFLRNCNTVLTFGTVIFLSQKLHSYLFPFKPTCFIDSSFEYMQQSCTIGPLRGEDFSIRYIYIIVQDVTEIVAYEKKLKTMNIMDSLTGIYNRRFFDFSLKEEFEKHKRYSKPLTLIMFDVDCFKDVNDKYGHRCGDYILKSVATISASIIRGVDVLARYGGDEFCCLLPETNIESGLIVAERLRKAIFDYEAIFTSFSVRVTVSLGISELRNELISPEKLFNNADEALYEAKSTGRNKVIARG
ncbi:MAG: GGDEF domain-containing protein [Nitrospirae bacterium]|nr:GGDEF domain-containing protein [Nitrospirota bacterium]